MKYAQAKEKKWYLDRDITASVMGKLSLMSGKQRIAPERIALKETAHYIFVNDLSTGAGLIDVPHLASTGELKKLVKGDKNCKTYQRFRQHHRRHTHTFSLDNNTILIVRRGGTGHTVKLFFEQAADAKAYWKILVAPRTNEVNKLVEVKSEVKVPTLNPEVLADTNKKVKDAVKVETVAVPDSNKVKVTKSNSKKVVVKVKKSN